MSTDGDLRQQAIKRVKKRRDFYAHLLAYALVNTFVVVIWLVTTPGGFFWPIFLIALWGIGLAMNAWDVWRGDVDQISEADIEREMHRMQRIQRHG